MNINSGAFVHLSYSNKPILMTKQLQTSQELPTKILHIFSFYQKVRYTCKTIKLSFTLRKSSNSIFPG